MPHITSLQVNDSCTSSRTYSPPPCSDGSFLNSSETQWASDDTTELLVGVGVGCREGGNIDWVAYWLVTRWVYDVAQGLLKHTVWHGLKEQKSWCYDFCRKQKDLNMKLWKILCPLGFNPGLSSLYTVAIPTELPSSWSIKYIKLIH